MTTTGSSGSSPLLPRYMRSAPPTMVNTASLTVAPGIAAFSLRTVAKSKRHPSSTRCADTVALKRVRGTLRGGSATSRRTNGPGSRLSPRTVRPTTRVMCPGERRLFTEARFNSSHGVGSRSGVHGSVGGAGGSTSADRSWVAVVISIPETPSIEA